MLLELQQSWCCNSFPWGPRPVLCFGHTPIVYVLYVLQCPAVHPVLQVRLQQRRTERDNDLHSTRIPKSLIERQCPIRSQCVCPALTLPRCEISPLFLLYFMWLLHAQFSNLSTSLCKPSPPSVEATASSKSASLADLLRTSSGPTCKSLMKTLRRSVPKWSPGEPC